VGTWPAAGLVVARRRPEDRCRLSPSFWQKATSLQDSATMASAGFARS
jgi:hypothetical protein